MALFDVFILIAAIAGVTIGWWRGLVQQLSSIVAFLLAVAITRLFGDASAALFRSIVPELSDSTWGSSIVGHVALFVLAYIGLRFAARLIKTTVGKLHMSVIDKAGGAAFASLKYLIALSLIFNLWGVVAPDSAPMKSDKMLSGVPYRFTVGLAPWVLNSDLVPLMGQAFTGKKADKENETK